MEHVEPSAIMLVAKGFIAPAYILIAVLLWIGAGNALWDTKAGRAVTALVAVFILCDLASYVSVLFGFPLIVVEAAHVLLAVAAWAFIFMRQTAVIAKALTDD